MIPATRPTLTALSTSSTGGLWTKPGSSPPRKTVLFFLLSLRLCAGDLWLRNGRIWTADPAQPWAESVLVRGNRIAAVGSNDDVARQAAGAQVIDLKRRLAIPGFHDAHMHFLGGSLGLWQVDLNGICTLPEMQQTLAAFAKSHPSEKWLRGRGWEYVCLPQGRLPVKEDLDVVVKDRPVYLAAYDGHTAWVNSAALQRAGITKDTQFAGFGEIVKDGVTGEPTGTLKEEAMLLVRRLLPVPGREEKIAALRAGLRLTARLGITSIQNANGAEDELELYEDLIARRDLNLRISFALPAAPGDSGTAMQRFARLRGKHGGPLLRVNAIKIMMDGVIESHTAAMLEPYTNQPATRGATAWTPSQFARTVTAADKMGLQVLTHAIGDRAVRMALDGYAAARKVKGDRDNRHRVEHIETIDPTDLPRFAALGVLASMQPIHADPGAVEIWSACIGPERTRRGFAWRSLENAGARLVFSSNWPASLSVDPIRGIHNAVNRQTTAGLPPGGWIPEERVSVETALRAYTINAAFAGHAEERLGMLRPGMLADIAVLSRDLFSIPPADIFKTTVDITLFDGRLVHGR